MSDVNRERVTLLVEALRDPASKQTRGRLGDESGYCCLGIACEVAIANGLELKRQERETMGDFEIHYDGKWLTLPEVVADWYGFPQCDPILASANGYIRRASVLNDDDRLPFPEIASFFEFTYLGGGDMR